MTLGELELSKPRRLYHYTTAEGLLGIIESRTLWATSIHYLNDSSEYRYAFSLARTTLVETPGGLSPVQVRALFSALEGDWKGLEDQSRFVTSFSEHKDQLSQWRAYGRPGGGISLGFDFETLAGIAKTSGFRLVRCEYDTKTQERRLVDEATRALEPADPDGQDGSIEISLLANEFIHELLDLASEFKDPAFKEEAEWRLASASIPSAGPHMHFRAGRSTLVPYLKVPLANSGEMLPIAEIVIGPTPHPWLARSALIDALAKTCTVKVEDIQNSRVPFRDW
jgi:hypothetical protein